jgi:four helix bundle protein
MGESILQAKSYKFALRVVRLCEYLTKNRKEFVLSRKVLESGTAIGALVEEARQGDDRNDYRLKLSIANKEAFKTNYWLRLMRDSEIISAKESISLLEDCEELQKMLISSLKTTGRSAESS